MADVTKRSILVVDDDKAMRQSLVELLEAAGWRVEALARATHVQAQIATHVPDVILTDVRMPGMTGLDLLAQMQDEDAPPLVLISAHADIPMAVSAMQGGAYSFVEKPYEPRRLLSILEHAADQHRMRRDNARLKSRLFSLAGLDRVLVGQTPEVTALRRDILDMVDTTSAVMILGETGTGKELVARALHDLGPNADAPFLALNCALLSPDSFEADMFGVSDQTIGRMAMVNGGTLFLDEVCSCPPSIQAMLLRVIEEKQIFPVGASEPTQVTFRLVSATNEDITGAVQQGRFRSDLLFRLNTFVLNLPALRSRRDDISLLIAHFLDHYARIYEVTLPELNQDDLAAALSHDWPGNVRELRNVCERRVLAARHGRGSLAQAINAHQDIEDVPDTLREAVATFERELIAKAIQAHGGRMDAAADALGIGRRTLNEKIVKLGLDKDALL